MKILIVGGTGLTGAHAALHLEQLGHNITLLARKQPAVPCLQHFPFIGGDYLDASFPVEALRGFDGLLFAAGADIRQLPPGEDEQAFYQRTNVEGVPRFIAKAKAAGIRKAVCIGSYYPMVVPEKIATSTYVRSRHLCDEAVRALSDATFSVCTLNAPFILGCVPGLPLPHLQALAQYAAGQLPGVPVFAPAGGVNHISSQSMSEAIASAFEHGKAGKAYLVGDENLSWKDYFEAWFAAAGNPQTLPVSTDEHPLLPDIILYAGRNAEICYTAPMDELHYAQGLIGKTIREVARALL